MKLLALLAETLGALPGKDFTLDGRMFPGDSWNCEFCPSGRKMIFRVCVSDYGHTVLGLV